MTTSSLRHRVSGDLVAVWLSRESELVRRDLATARHRAARTLVKTPALRVVLIALCTNGEIRQHVAEGPITVHVLDGSLELYTPEGRTTLGAGMLMSLEGGIPHWIASAEGSLFLLTVVNLAAARTPKAVTLPFAASASG